MRSSVVIAALTAILPVVSAHGRVNVVTGDAGGNGTALAIQGGVIALTGGNSKTEKDTTVFGKTKITTDGLGKTTGQGKNKAEMLTKAMALSGDTLPQVSSTGGQISGTFHVVTTDGAGPLQAVIDSTATGKFSTGAKADVVTQVPGKNGNIAPGKNASPLDAITRRFPPVYRMLKRWGIVKRAVNVNKDFPMAFSIPAGTTCSGTIGNQQNVCMLKIANSNPAGPFGGVIVFQMAGQGAGTGAGATTGNTTAAASTSSTGATSNTKKAGGKQAREFTA